MEDKSKIARVHTVKVYGFMHEEFSGLSDDPQILRIERVNGDAERFDRMQANLADEGFEGEMFDAVGFKVGVIACDGSTVWF
jgi:hypothetical protein